MGICRQVVAGVAQAGILELVTQERRGRLEGQKKAK